MDADRRKAFLAVLANLVKEYRAWCDTAGLLHMNERLTLAVSETRELFDSGDIPYDVAPLASQVARIAKAWAAWAPKADEERNPIPGPDFWDALGEIDTTAWLLANQPPQAIESIQQLTDQKVPDRQVCSIYGFERPDGSPDFAALNRERATPGSVLGKDWVAPNQREWAEKKRRAMEEASAARSKYNAKVAPPPRGNESLEGLAEAGVTVRQASVILQVSEAEIRKEAERLGLEMRDEYPSMTAAQGLYDKRMTPEQEVAFDAGLAARAPQRASQTPQPPQEQYEELADVETPGGPMTLEQQIVFYKQQNPDWTNRQVADAVSREDEQVSAQKVRQVLARYEKDPAAFGVEVGG